MDTMEETLKKMKVGYIRHSDARRIDKKKQDGRCIISQMPFLLGWGGGLRQS